MLIVTDLVSLIENTLYYNSHVYNTTVQIGKFRSQVMIINDRSSLYDKTVFMESIYIFATVYAQSGFKRIEIAQW